MSTRLLEMGLKAQDIIPSFDQDWAAEKQENVTWF